MIVEMVDVAHGRIVWGKTFDDSVSNIFTLQDAIAGEVAAALGMRLSWLDQAYADGQVVFL